MTAAIRVMPWPDPVLDAVGHDPRSWYVETFWLPTLGPTALLLLRHLADRFEANPKGIDCKCKDDRDKCCRLFQCGDSTSVSDDDVDFLLHKLRRELSDTLGPSL